MRGSGDKITMMAMGCWLLLLQMFFRSETELPQNQFHVKMHIIVLLGFSEWKFLFQHSSEIILI